MTEGVPLESAVILVVDDEPSIRSFVTRTLEGFGATAHQAENGLKAQQLSAQLSHIDLLVTDVILPDVGGHELATTIRTWHPRMQVVVMSGYLSGDVAPAGDGFFLKKPFQTQEFVETVRCALRMVTQGTNQDC